MSFAITVAVGMLTIFLMVAFAPRVFYKMNKPQTVFSLERAVDYEGNQTLGVFESLEAAVDGIRFKSWSYEIYEWPVGGGSTVRAWEWYRGELKRYA